MPLGNVFTQMDVSVRTQSSEQTHTHHEYTPAEPDFTKYDMFLGQHLCWPWNNIVINQSDLMNKFIIFVKFRLTISVCCLYISVINL